MGRLIWDPRDSWRTAAEPRPHVTHAEWAETRYRPSASAIQGPFNFDHSPYLRGVMAALDDDAVRDIFLCFAAQVGKSITFEIATGRAMECAPQPILWLSASDDVIELLSGNRIDPLLELPALRALVSDVRSTNASRTKKFIQYLGGWLRLGSAGSIAPYVQDAYSLAIVDEWDKYPSSVKKEGSPWALTRLRQRWYEERGAKTLAGSTPAIAETSNIWPAYQDSDRRRFFVPCTNCREYQHLIWDQVKYKAPYSEAEPRYVCEHCEFGMTDVQRIAATRKGEWQAEGVFRGAAGFHLNSMYASNVRLHELVAQWIKAQGSPDKLQTFMNGQLALPWHVQAEAPLDPDAVPRHGWGAEVPQQAIALVAFADLQGAATKPLERIEVTTYGVDTDGTFLGVKHDVLRVEKLGDKAPFAQLDDFLAKKWTRADGLEMILDACAVDISHDMDQVLGWLFTDPKKPRTHPENVTLVPNAIGSKTWLVGSWGDPSGRIGGELFPLGLDRRTGLPNPTPDKNGRTYLRMNRSQAKHELYERLRRTGPGSFMYPDLECFDTEFFKGLVAEAIELRTNSAGEDVAKWVKTQPRNEPLDCAAGCLALVRALEPFMPRFAALRPPGAATPAKPAAPAQSVPKPPAQRVTLVRKIGMPID